MPSSTRDQLEASASSLTNAAAKLAEIFKQQAALTAELETAAADADAAGLTDFAELFRTMAAKLSPLSSHDNKPNTLSAKRRGRPPKSAEDQTAPD